MSTTAMHEIGLREPAPRINPELQPPAIIGAGSLGKLVFDGLDPAALRQGLLAQRPLQNQDPAVLLDLGLLTLYAGEHEPALELQQMALRHQTVFRVAGLHGSPPEPRRRLLALCAPGDLMVNTPLEFILTGSAVQLDLLYVLPDQPLPEEVPEHDVAMVAVAQSDATDPTLRRLERLVSAWPRPVLNRPAHLLPLSRPEMGRRLQGIAGLTMPGTLRLGRQELQAWPGLAEATLALPFIVRPVDTHAGHGLEKIESWPELESYLGRQPAAGYYAAPFHDFRSPDGNYRKYRIVFMAGEPFLCHLAISRDWMVHYVSADMATEAAHRAEEAAAMAGFAEGFGRRHAAAMQALCGRVGLDYFGVDCAETPNGELLIFEVASAMVIHAMDSPLVYPYKQEQMARTFTAFHDLLDRAAARGTKRAPGKQGRAWR